MQLLLSFIAGPLFQGQSVLVEQDPDGTITGISCSTDASVCYGRINGVGCAQPDCEYAIVSLKHDILSPLAENLHLE